ncbi:hypothetical protein CV102_00430 [Natronococcus pandeyae]|uniref:Uncharacterized protein n=1 Tax=Natronococcus pandeyae TaxID=2055836 RepID=A0A8J8Q6P1_9EURY|nr:hypothetical protein CV102_00430 [Natronococcus pandeyae]
MNTADRFGAVTGPHDGTHVTSTDRTSSSSSTITVTVPVAPSTSTATVGGFCDSSCGGSQSDGLEKRTVQNDDTDERSALSCRSTVADVMFLRAANDS